jgi:sulfur-oxidizing protein SoxY
LKAGRRGFLGALAAAVAPAAIVAPAKAGAQSPSVAPAQAGAQFHDLDALVRGVTNGAPAKSGRVTLEIPRLADNGHSVAVRVDVASPMTAADHVNRVVLLSERNPRPVIATFHLTPRVGRAEVVTRVRLNGTQRVVAVAELSDGSYWSAMATVEVTESACLDAG